MSQAFNYKDHKKEDIKMLLEANCDIEQVMLHVEPFTDSEIQHEELQLSRKTQELFELEQKLKELSEPLKQEIKEVKAMQKEMNSLIKQGGYEIEGKTYAFLDNSTNNAQIYSERGLLIESRPLTRKERQHTLSFDS